jgi:ATP-dependent Zn protease
MPDDEKTTAYHEAGHAVMAYDLFGSGASAELSILPDADCLGAHSNSPEFEALVHKLVIFAKPDVGGMFGVILQADKDWWEANDLATDWGGDPTYDGWDDDQVDVEEIRLNHQCDQMIALFIAGHAAEEVFCDIPNDPTSDDWDKAKDFAVRLGRGTDIAGEYDLTSYFSNQRRVVKELLDSKYRHAVEALVGQLLEKKTLTGTEVSKTIQSYLLLFGNT